MPAHQVNVLISGAFSPGSITFDVVADGPDGAEVTATLCSTRPGLTQLAAPLLRRTLGRALRGASRRTETIWSPDDMCRDSELHEGRMW